MQPLRPTDTAPPVSYTVVPVRPGAPVTDPPPSTADLAFTSDAARFAATAARVRGDVEAALVGVERLADLAAQLGIVGVSVSLGAARAHLERALLETATAARAGGSGSRG